MAVASWRIATTSFSDAVTIIVTVIVAAVIDGLWFALPLSRHARENRR